MTGETSNTTIISFKLKGIKDKFNMYLCKTIDIAQILAEVFFADYLIFGCFSFWTNFVAKAKSIISINLMSNNEYL